MKDRGENKQNAMIWPAHKNREYTNNNYEITSYQYVCVELITLPPWDKRNPGYIWTKTKPQNTTGQAARLCYAIYMKNDID
jgi:hypothetical protein